MNLYFYSSYSGKSSIQTYILANQERTQLDIGDAVGKKQKVQAYD